MAEIVCGLWDRRRMTIIMRRLVAVSLVVAGFALPACAQRGGSVGRGGGFVGHSAPASRGSFSSAGRSSSMGAPPLSSSRYSGANLRAVGRSGVPAAATTARGNFRRPVRAGEDRYRRPYAPSYGVGVGVPYGVAGWIGSDCLFPDCGSYGDSAYAGPAPANYPAAEYDPAPPDQGGAAPIDSFRPAYASTPVSPEPDAESAVTLVFKDGRPAEQIHNYMLTRTTLYVRDERHREIPVDELDLAATAKANREAGVDFEVPAGVR